MTNTQHTNCLISSCLLGLCTRYDGKVKEQSLDLSKFKDFRFIPVCPEQLGGLPTPRPPADIVGGDGDDVLQGQANVLSKEGEDFTKQFIHGARQVSQIARKLDCTAAILKARSPSCAVNGTAGVTAAILRKQGLTLIEADF